tara:strand:- start:453 stop:1112 length:660 start_codon:yes stop_codon:yes gene_type:complete
MKNSKKCPFINFSWNGTILQLYSNLVLFIPSTGELLISDIHIGKAEYFQLNGIPITNNEDENNINRIYKLINEFKPNKVIILGDLFHSKYSLNKNLISKVERLFETFKNKIELIEGNHDKGCQIKDISYLKEIESLNLIFTHEPIRKKDNKTLNICGHYHPKLILKNNQDKLSFKCFAFDSFNNNLYLPSFGDLTGGFMCKKHFKKWAIISENNIVEIN